MKAAAEILATAAGLVDGDRKATHGDAAVTFGAAARLWEAHFRVRFGLSIDLDASDVADLLADFKKARRICGGAVADHGLDRCGYVGLAEALAAERWRERLPADRVFRAAPRSEAEASRRMEDDAAARREAIERAEAQRDAGREGS